MQGVGSAGTDLGDTEATHVAQLASSGVKEPEKMGVNHDRLKSGGVCPLPGKHKKSKTGT